jgi:LytS/YehU family sensor histidine kinase
MREAFVVREIRRATRVRTLPYFGLAFPYVMAWVFSTSVKFSMDYLGLERKRKESENENLKSELALLRSQISPHFMFNVLNSLTALARKKSDGLEPIIIKLSQLMRYTIYHSAVPKVDLETELEYLQNYIDLQRLRFGHHIAIHFAKDVYQPDFQIEPMLLISFVENAFKHGSGLVTNPSINIAIKCKDSILNFDVRNKFIPGTEKDATHGVGLKNVKRRLELLYEHQYDLKILDEAPWFIVNLTLIGK